MAWPDSLRCKFSRQNRTGDLWRNRTFVVTDVNDRFWVGFGQIRTRAIAMQQKTGSPVQFELLPDARASLLAWLESRGGTVDDYVFPSRVARHGNL